MVWMTVLYLLTLVALASGLVLFLALGWVLLQVVGWLALPVLMAVVVGLFLLAKA
jgi:hypothetical protein